MIRPVGALDGAVHIRDALRQRILDGDLAVLILRRRNQNLIIQISVLQIAAGNTQICAVIDKREIRGIGSCDIRAFHKLRRHGNFMRPFGRHIAVFRRSRIRYGPGVALRILIRIIECRMISKADRLAGHIRRRAERDDKTDCLSRTVIRRIDDISVYVVKCDGIIRTGSLRAVVSVELHRRRKVGQNLRRCSVMDAGKA